MSKRDQLLSVKDLTMFFGVSRQSIFRWIATGQLKPTLKIGRTVRFSRADVDSFMAANRDA